MKKLLSVLVVLSALQLGAQSFYKGALVTELNYGIDIYNVHYHYELKVSPYTKYDTYNKAGSKSFNLNAQYGITNWFGLGIKAKFDNYIVSKDSVSGITPRVSGTEFGLVTDFHMVRVKHFNLSAGLDIGYSDFIYRSNNGFGDELYGDGLWTNFHLTPRVYFGRFGFNVAFNFPALTYKNMKFNDKTANQFINPTWKASGFGVTFGLQFRFLKNKE